MRNDINRCRPAVHRSILAEHEATRTLLESADRLVAKALATRETDSPHLQAILKKLDAQRVAHEARESRWLFPKLQARCPPLGAVLARMELEHTQMEREIAALLNRKADDVDALADTWQRFASTAIGHMSVEERYIVPVAADFLTRKDWDEIGLSVPRQLS